MRHMSGYERCRTTPRLSRRNSPRLASRVGSPPAKRAGTRWRVWAEGRSEPSQGSHDRVGEGGLCPRIGGCCRSCQSWSQSAGGFGEAEREGASVASGCGGEGAGPEVPEGGSERGRGGGWGAEGRSEPSQGSHDRVGEGGLRPPEPERGRGWEPSQGSHYYEILNRRTSSRSRREPPPSRNTNRMPLSPGPA